MSDIADRVRDAVEELMGSGHQPPFYVAVIGANGSFLTATCAAVGIERSLEVHGVHGDADFSVPVNIMIVDSRGEAARIVIHGRGGGTVLQ